MRAGDSNPSHCIFAAVSLWHICAVGGLTYSIYYGKIYWRGILNLSLDTWLDDSCNPAEVESSCGINLWLGFGHCQHKCEISGGIFGSLQPICATSVPIWEQMTMIMPTALSYSGYTALGAAFGKSAMAKVFNVTLRRGLAICFVMYGVLLGGASVQAGS